jgi:hypothetical protein
MQEVLDVPRRQQLTTYIITVGRMISGLVLKERKMRVFTLTPTCPSAGTSIFPDRARERPGTVVILAFSYRMN